MTKVANYETYVVKVPYEEGRGATHIVVRLRTDDGLTGVGYFSMLAPWVVKTFMSAVDQAAGAPPRPWWSYTPERKRLLTR